MILGDKPLIQYQLEQLLKIRNSFSDIIVYCSEESIKEYLLPGVQFLKRPKFLDEDKANATQIIQEFIKEVDSEWYIMDNVTAPFVCSETILDMMDKALDESGEYDSSFAAKGIRNFLWTYRCDNGKRELLNLNFDITNIPRTQDLEPLFVDKCGPYVFSKDLFLKTNRRIGFNPYIKELSFRESIDIDTREDFEVAQKFI